MNDVKDLLDRPSVALGVSTATTAGGALTALAEVHTWTTELSLIVGLIMSLVLLRNHIKKGRMNDKEIELLDLEIARAKREEEEAMHGHSQDHQG